MVFARQMRFVIPSSLTALLYFFATAGHFSACAQQTANAASRIIGTVSAINGSALTLKTDNGTVTTVTVNDGTRILRIAPGQKTLAGAATIGISEIAPGDRALVLATGDASAPVAMRIIVNKQADLAQRQRDQQEDWQRRGIGGIVKSVDPANGLIVLTAGNRSISIKILPSTILRRYAPNSVKFSEAKPSTIDQIRPGDQVTARGDRNTDNGVVTAEEIVSGSFRNIVGPVVSTDARAGTITVTDLLTKKRLLIHVIPDSDLRRLDPATAQMIAMRLKSAGTNQQRDEGAHPASSESDQPAERQNGGGAPGGGGGNFARLLQRAPEISVSDLHKGNTVMIVATQGDPDSATAIRLVAGVEPMLEASASGSESMFSSAWNLGGGSSGGGEEQGNP